MSDTSLRQIFDVVILLIVFRASCFLTIDKITEIKKKFGIV